jgi:hypothetical protein
MTGRPQPALTTRSDTRAFEAILWASHPQGEHDRRQGTIAAPIRNVPLEPQTGVVRPQYDQSPVYSAPGSDYFCCNNAQSACEPDGGF